MFNTLLCHILNSLAATQLKHAIFTIHYFATYQCVRLKISTFLPQIVHLINKTVVKIVSNMGISQKHPVWFNKRDTCIFFIHIISLTIFHRFLTWFLLQYFNQSSNKPDLLPSIWLHLFVSLHFLEVNQFTGLYQFYLESFCSCQFTITMNIFMEAVKDISGSSLRNTPSTFLTSSTNC